MKNHTVDRRDFLKKSSILALGSTSLASMPFTGIAIPQSNQQGINIVGPKEGYSPQIGTLVSMMDWMRNTILMPVRGMSVEDLDYLVDDQANSIGAMLMHLAATERFYQIHTFEGKKWGEWDKKDAKEWNVASGLGDAARKEIKGHEISYYLDKLETVRNKTLNELAKRDDKWLLSVDQDWFWGPTNNYCKWFHVVEHESNHNGQFKFIKSRLPSAQK